MKHNDDLEDKIIKIAAIIMTALALLSVCSIIDTLTDRFPIAF